MKKSAIGLGALMGSYHQSTFPHVAAPPSGPRIGDKTTVDRWNEANGEWESLELVWDGSAFVGPRSKKGGKE